MAKQIKLENKPQDIFGKPLQIVDIENRPPDGQAPKIIDAAALTDILKLLVVSIPRQKLTMQDSIHAYDLIGAIRKTEKAGSNHLELTEGLHDWIKNIVREHGPALFGVNAKAVLDAVEDIEKAHEPARSSCDTI